MESLSGAQVNVWLDRLLDVLTAEHVAAIDVESSKRTSGRAYHAQIQIKYKAGIARERLHCHKAAIMTAIQQATPLMINNRRAYAVVEAPPHLRPYHAAGGRFLGWCERQGGSLAMMYTNKQLRIEWRIPLRSIT